MIYNTGRLDIIIPEEITIITCDKCGHYQSAPITNYNEIFFASGWVFTNGRKCKHLCIKCQTPKQRSASKFVRENFPPY